MLFLGAGAAADELPKCLLCPSGCWRRRAWPQLSAWPAPAALTPHDAPAALPAPLLLGPRPSVCFLAGAGVHTVRPRPVPGEAQALLRGGDPGIPPGKGSLRRPRGWGPGSLGLLRWRKNSVFWPWQGLGALRAELARPVRPCQDFSAVSASVWVHDKASAQEWCGPAVLSVPTLGLG